MKKNTSVILVILNVLAWITFVGLMIKAGAILTALGVGIYNPEASKSLYMKLDLSKVRDYYLVYYLSSVGLLAVFVLLEAYVAYMVTRVLSKIKMENPFTPDIATRLQSISYIILFAWVVAMMYNGYSKWLMEKVEGLNVDLISGDFLLIAGVVFVFAQIFKRGVEIQSENELTV